MAYHSVPICGIGKALDLGAWCVISGTFLYLSGVIHFIGRCPIGEVLQLVFVTHESLLLDSFTSLSPKTISFGFYLICLLMGMSKCTL